MLLKMKSVENTDCRFIRRGLTESPAVKEERSKKNRRGREEKRVEKECEMRF